MRTLILLALLAATCPAAEIIPSDGQDDTEAIQEYLDALQETPRPAAAPLPAGILQVSDTLEIGPAMGLKLEGAGGHNRSPSAGWDRHRFGTILQWHGPDDKPLLKLTSCSGTTIEGINITVARGKELATGILIRHGRGSLNFAFRDLGFIGPEVGIQWGEGRQEHTCANATYDHCHFEQCETAVLLKNNQSLNHLFIRPNFSWGKYAVHVQQGGNIQMLAPHCNSMEGFLHLGIIGSNSRGFDISLGRFDGHNIRTNWLSFEDPTDLRTYGTIVFRSCGQNAGQRESDLPLVQVAPGAKVVLEACGFHARDTLTGGNLAHVYSERRADGQLILRECDGLPSDMEDCIELHGPRSYYAFERCRGVWSGNTSVGNFPGPPADLSAEEIAALKLLASRKDCLLDGIDITKAVEAGKLQVTLPEEND